MAIPHPERWLLSPEFARKIDNGRYWLFDVECPTEIMAAYERLHRGYNVQDNGDILLAWIVTTTLVRSDTTFGQRMVDALKVLGWQSPT
jgi:hypothetical protein